MEHRIAFTTSSDEVVGVSPLDVSPRQHRRSRLSRRDVLRLSPGLRTMTMAITASLTADAIASLLLAQVLVFGDQRQLGAGALLRAVALATLPIVLFGPVAGWIVDRWPRRTLLSNGHLLRAAVTIAAALAPLTHQRWIGYVALVSLLCLSRVLYTCRSASTPHLVAPSHLVAADSLLIVASMCAGTAGGAFGSLAVWTSPAAGFVFAGGLHVYAATRYRSLPLDLGGRSAPSPVRGDWRDALLELRVRRTRTAIAATAFHRCLLGAGIATVVLMVDQRYRVEAPGYALTLGIAAAGSFFGTLSATRAGLMRWTRMVIAACSLAGIAFLVSTAVGAVGASLAAVVVASFAFQNLRVCADARVQASANDAAVGRVFATYDLVYNTAFAIGAVGAIVIGVQWAPRSMLAAIGVTYIVGAMFLALTHREEAG